MGLTAHQQPSPEVDAYGARREGRAIMAVLEELPMDCRGTRTCRCHRDDIITSRESGCVRLWYMTDGA